MSLDPNAKSLFKIKSLSDFREELCLQGPQTLYIIVGKNIYLHSPYYQCSLFELRFQTLIFKAERALPV